MVAHTSLYAAILALLFCVLSVRVIRHRRQAKIAIGDHGNEALIRAQRVQGNCAEYTPFALILFALVELQGAPVWLVHLLALPFTVGRFLHAWGVSQAPENFRWRVLGMALTFTAIITSACALLVLYAVQPQ